MRATLSDPCRGYDLASTGSYLESSKLLRLLSCLGFEFCNVIWLQKRILFAFSLGKKRKCFAHDEALEILARLVSQEGIVVFKELIEQKLRGIVLALTDQKQFHAGLALCLRQKAAQRGDNRVRLSFLRFPLSDHEDATAPPDFVYCTLVHAALVHNVCSFGFSELRLRLGRQRKSRLGQGNGSPQYREGGSAGE